MPAATAEDWPGFVRLAREMRKGKATWPAELQSLRKWYEPLLRYNYDDAHHRLSYVAQLEQIAAGYTSRRRFLTDLALDPPEGSKDPSNGSTKAADCAVLSTMHSAKGQEWRVVRLLNVVDG